MLIPGPATPASAPAEPPAGSSLHTMGAAGFWVQHLDARLRSPVRSIKLIAFAIKLNVAHCQNIKKQ